MSPIFLYLASAKHRQSAESADFLEGLVSEKREVVEKFREAVKKIPPWFTAVRSAASSAKAIIDRRRAVVRQWRRAAGVEAQHFETLATAIEKSSDALEDLLLFIKGTTQIEERGVALKLATHLEEELLD
mmetsp:Transcript_21572/g.57610  ORF Transcript_21572/g.57610 Transcript_21572/m.57610 type:complete len:130 (-) Transcript_21572:80-469(-)